MSTFGHVYESTPSIAEKAFSSKPFSSVSDLEEAMASIVRAMSTEEKHGLIRAHPELGRKEPMGASSTAEQASAGLNDLGEESEQQLSRLNQSYSSKFQFPFVICVAENNRTQIIDAITVRLQKTMDEEASNAIDEIIKIAHIRLLKLFSDTATLRSN